jgi:DedD protein
MPPPSSEQDLKRRARRRLIGAVALAVTAVVVLPLLLEKSPPPAGPLTVHMPPPPAAAPIVAHVPDSLPPPAGSGHEAQRIGRVANDEAPAPERPPAHEPDAAAKPAHAPAAKPERPAAVADASPARPAQAPRPAPKAPPVRPAEKQAALAVGATPAHGAGAGGHFVVQLAALSDRGRAEALKARASRAGLPVFLDQTEGEHVLTRVRAGPFGSREEAAAAAARLAAIGIQGKVMQK